jgi:hypothetical protein
MPRKINKKAMKILKSGKSTLKTILNTRLKPRTISNNPQKSADPIFIFFIVLKNKSREKF